MKRKLAPRYVGQYKIIERSGRVAYKLQLPPEMRAIFNVFHVFQLRKCLRIPEERVKTKDIKIESDLAYEEKPVQLLENKERVTQNRVIRFHKVMWSNHSEHAATWEREDYLHEVYPEFYEKGRSFKSRDEISIRGEGL